MLSLLLLQWIPLPIHSSHRSAEHLRNVIRTREIVRKAHVHAVLSQIDIQRNESRSLLPFCSRIKSLCMCVFVARRFSPRFISLHRHFCTHQMTSFPIVRRKFFITSLLSLINSLECHFCEFDKLFSYLFRNSHVIIYFFARSLYWLRLQSWATWKILISTADKTKTKRQKNDVISKYTKQTTAARLIWTRRGWIFSTIHSNAKRNEGNNANSHFARRAKVFARVSEANWYPDTFRYLNLLIYYLFLSFLFSILSRSFQTTIFQVSSRHFRV